MVVVSKKLFLLSGAFYFLSFDGLFVVALGGYSVSGRRRQEYRGKGKV